MRAGSGDISVGEELLCLFVVELHGRFLDEFPLVVETAEEVGGSAAVSFGSCPSVDVERDSELLERILDNIMVTVNDILGSNALLTSLDGDRDAMFVRTADEEDLFTAEAKIPGIDVGRDINAGEMTDVDRAVGVRESGSDESSFEIFHVSTVLESDTRKL